MQVAATSTWFISELANHTPRTSVPAKPMSRRVFSESATLAATSRTKKPRNMPLCWTGLGICPHESTSRMVANWPLNWRLKAEVADFGWIFDPWTKKRRRAAQRFRVRVRQNFSIQESKSLFFLCEATWNNTHLIEISWDLFKPGCFRWFPRFLKHSGFWFQKYSMASLAHADKKIPTCLDFPRLT